jgi:hypothetical protein
MINGPEGHRDQRGRIASHVLCGYGMAQLCAGRSNTRKEHTRTVTARKHKQTLTYLGDV